MKRLKHELPGIQMRISRLSKKYEEQTEDTQQVWQDARGRQFFQQYTSEVKSVVNQLVSSLTLLTELTDQIQGQLADPDRDSAHD